MWGRTRTIKEIKSALERITELELADGEAMYSQLYRDVETDARRERDNQLSREKRANFWQVRHSRQLAEDETRTRERQAFWYERQQRQLQADQARLAERTAYWSNRQQAELEEDHQTKTAREAFWDGLQRERNVEDIQYQKKLNAHHIAGNTFFTTGLAFAFGITDYIYRPFQSFFYHISDGIQLANRQIWRGLTWVNRQVKEVIKTIVRPLARAISFVGHQVKESAQTIGRSIDRGVSFINHHLREYRETLYRKIETGIEDANPYNAFVRNADESLLFSNPNKFSQEPNITGFNRYSSNKEMYGLLAKIGKFSSPTTQQPVEELIVNNERTLLLC